MERQPAPYHQHRYWIKNLKASPEQIRQALLKMRHTEPVGNKEFEQYLQYMR